MLIHPGTMTLKQDAAPRRNFASLPALRPATSMATNFPTKMIHSRWADSQKEGYPGDW